MIQVKPISDVLFSNDLDGFLRLLATVFSMAGLVLAGIWKMLSSRLTSRAAKLGTDVDLMGGKLNTIQSNCTAEYARTDARIGELIRRADAKDVELRAVTGDIGRLEAKVDQMLSQGTDNKVEIIGKFSEIAAKVTDEIHTLDLKFERISATIAERDRMGRSREQ